ncbi:MAG: hypothetical protein EOP84_07420 [Verrucomicrobiaceae bacterium]|nr:MAG: hypothetical protein EOP84_07420 [Verrucomicrobiaceae bacterium]
MKLPSLRFLRFLRTRKFWQRSVFAFVCFITLVAAAYTIENYRGRKAWERYQREAAARGVKLRIEEFIKPPIPDEENFAAIPLFQELQSRDDKVRERAANSIQIPEQVDFGPRGSYGGRNSEEPLNFDDWRKIFVAHGLIDSTTDDAAADVLRGLDRYEPVLEQLRKAARERPLSRLNAGWEKGFDADFFRLQGLIGLTRLLSLRTAALLVVGRSEEALENLQVSFRLCEMLKGEASLLSGMLRVVMLTIAITPASEGLAAHQWKEPQLREVEAALQSINLLDEYPQMLASERAMCNTFFEKVQLRGRDDQSSTGLFFAPFDLIPGPKSFRIELIPEGWICQNRVRINQWYDRTIAKSRAPVPGSTSNEDHLWRNGQWWEWPYNYILYAVTFRIGGQQEIITNAQTEILLCRVAGAIERHYLRIGSLPVQLTGLAPSELPQVPRDPFSGSPFHYVPRADGTYLLYSAGPDGKDDGGERDKDIVWTATPPFPGTN